MIAYLRGELAEKTDNSVIVFVNGLGYELLVPNTTLSILPQVGEEIELHTYLQVKEDQIALFGFHEKNDLRIFKLLITVNGIGPKGALSVLSAMSSDELMFAVLSDDVKAIARTPGIGAKTAGKLILELKDKFSLMDAYEERLSGNAAGTVGSKEISGDSAAKQETVQALTALGYSATEAMKAVKRVEGAEAMTSGELLRNALKNI